MSAQANQPVRFISIPVDEVTLQRLLDLADMCHADVKAVAASLLHDVLAEDADAHLLEVVPDGFVGHA